MAVGRRVSGSGAERGSKGVRGMKDPKSARSARSATSGKSSASPRRIPDGPPARDGASEAVHGWRALLNPLWCYHGFIVAVFVLACFGVIMVFSSSSVAQVSDGNSPWTKAFSQGAYCLLGFVAAFVVSRIRPDIYRRMSTVAMLCALIVQALTFTPLGMGSEETGNNGWIGWHGFTLQPAEITKLALCIWLPHALMLARRRARTQGYQAYLMPVLVYAVALGLVMGGKDLGTAMIIVFIGLTAFVIGDFPTKPLLAAGGALIAMVAVAVIVSPNRLNRVLAAYRPCTDMEGVCYQSAHARYALASGGLLGVGLGNSREKWEYLPEAHNDFIFAVIGEELGFVGTLTVLLLFVVIAWSLLCVALRIRDRYTSMVLVCVTVWIVGQALVNIGVVVGVFPVLGVPMPYVSAGGSSMVMCLAAAGVAVALMRAQPQIRAESRRV